MKKKARSIAVLVTCLFLTIVISCQSPVIFDEVVEFGENGWHKEEVAEFNVDIKDTSLIMDVGMTFLHGEDYPYSNLWLFIDMEYEDSLMAKDTIEFFMSEVSGKWLGDKQGNGYEFSILYQHGVKVGKPGNYNFKITQGMRHEVLPNIESVEFWMQKVN